MKCKITLKEIIILIVISILSVLIFSDFDMTKSLELKILKNNYYLPVPFLFPSFFLFLYFNTYYLKFCYSNGKNILQKIIFGTLNYAITISIFIIGFKFWKNTQGDIDIAFFGETKDAFQMTFRNLYFWVFYQSILMTYGLSVLKIIVSKRRK